MKLVLLLLGYSLSVRAENVADALKSVGYKNENLKSAELLKNLQRKGSKKTFTTIKFDVAKNIYELELTSPVSSAEAEREQKNHIGVIVRSYSDQPTPYSGEITNIAKCSTYFNPKIKNQLKIDAKTITLVESFIDKSFNYGVCEKKLIKYQACTSFFYDSNRQQNLKLKIVTDPGKNCEKLSLDFYRDLHNL